EARGKASRIRVILEVVLQPFAQDVRSPWQKSGPLREQVVLTVPHTGQVRPSIRSSWRRTRKRRGLRPDPSEVHVRVIGNRSEIAALQGDIEPKALPGAEDHVRVQEWNERESRHRDRDFVRTRRQLRQSVIARDGAERAKCLSGNGVPRLNGYARKSSAIRADRSGNRAGILSHREGRERDEQHKGQNHSHGPTLTNETLCVIPETL